MKYKIILSLVLLGCIIQANGQPIQLSTNNIEEYHLCWSPDGTKLAFANSYYPPVSFLWYIDAESGEVNQINTGGMEGDYYVSWLNTDDVVFDANNGYGVFNIYKANIYGGGPEQITNYFYMMPSISPDGNWMLCSNMNTIFKIPVGGGQTEILVEGSTVYHPAWSCDGQYVIYSKEIDGNVDIWMALAEEYSEEIQLTFSEEKDDRASWGPNSQEVYYVHGEWESSDIMKVNVETLETTMVIDEPGRVSYPVFSPDGTKMAYTSNASGSSEIWITDYNPGVGIEEQKTNKLAVFPNPSTMGYNISFELEKMQDVTIKIQNSIGQQLDLIQLKNQSPGDHLVYWQPESTPKSGTSYFCTIIAGTKKYTEKLVIVR